MNQNSQKEFNRVTLIDPAELTFEDITFLKARSAYLRPEQKQVYAEILGDVKEMSKKDKAVFNKENRKAIAKAEKEALEKEKATKTIKEAQNPEGK